MLNSILRPVFVWKTRASMWICHVRRQLVVVVVAKYTPCSKEKNERMKERREGEKHAFSAPDP